MELPLTEPCPQCGNEMEPRGRVRRGRVIYVCPECGHEMEVAAEPEDIETEEESSS